MKALAFILTAFLLYALIAVAVITLASPEADKLGKLWDDVASEFEHATNRT